MFRPRSSAPGSAATAALTLDVYSHVTPDMEREAVAAIDEILQVR